MRACGATVNSLLFGLRNTDKVIVIGIRVDSCALLRNRKLLIWLIQMFANFQTPKNNKNVRNCETYLQELLLSVQGTHDVLSGEGWVPGEHGTHCTAGSRLPLTLLSTGMATNIGVHF